MCLHTQVTLKILTKNGKQDGDLKATVTAPLQSGIHDSVASCAADPPVNSSPQTNSNSSEQSLVAFAEKVLKYCTKDNPEGSLSQADVDQLLTSIKQSTTSSSSSSVAPYEAHDGFLLGAPKAACHADRIWTADGINQLRATADGEIGEWPSTVDNCKAQL